MTPGAPRRFGAAPFLTLALALAIFAAVYFGGRERDLATELARLRRENSRQNIELTRVNEAFAILTAADAALATFGEAPSKPAGRVFASPSRGILLIAGNLPPAPPGKAYQMWIVSRGKTNPAGMFQSASDGGALHMQGGPARGTQSVAVTLENASGAAQPTSPPLFSVSIPPPSR